MHWVVNIYHTHNIIHTYILGVQCFHDGLTSVDDSEGTISLRLGHLHKWIRLQKKTPQNSLTKCQQDASKWKNNKSNISYHSIKLHMNSENPAKGTTLKFSKFWMSSCGHCKTKTCTNVLLPKWSNVTLLFQRNPSCPISWHAVSW